MPTDLPGTSPETSRGSRFTVASWVVLLGGALLTYAMFQWAHIHRRPGEWLPGIRELLVGAMATAVGSFVCGLMALLRRERCRWVALPPFLVGLGTLGYFAFNFLSKQ